MQGCFGRGLSEQTATLIQVQNSSDRRPAGRFEIRIKPVLISILPVPHAIKQKIEKPAPGGKKKNPIAAGKVCLSFSVKNALKV